MAIDWWSALSRIEPHDLLDILIITVIAYNLLLIVKGTRGWYIAGGILSLVIFYYVARLLSLRTLEWLLAKFGPYAVFALVVIFQSEIRRALAELGRGNPLGRLWRRRRRRARFEEVVLAATALADRKIGGLIVIERAIGLRNHIESGVELDAAVTYDLLVSIFTAGTPLHDGAVIIQGDRVAAAACFLPLTLDPYLSKEFGTRHRAALGISQETDATAIVISEETGIISVVSGGVMARNLDGPGLLAHLHGAEDRQSAPGQGGRKRTWWSEGLALLRSLFVRNAGLKALSVLVGALVWFQVAGEETVQRIVAAPVVFTNVPAGLEIVGDAPTEVAVVVQADRRAAPLDSGRFAVVVDLRSARPGDQLFHLTEQNVAQRPSGVEVVNLLNTEIRLRLEKTEVRSASVVPRLEGKPAAGFKVEEVSVTPKSVSIVGPEKRVRQIGWVSTEPIRLEGASDSFSRTVALEAPDARVRFDGVEQVAVSVTISPVARQGGSRAR